MSRLNAVMALLSALLGALIALHHPLSPAVVSGLFVAWIVVVARYPALWLLLVPAMLPIVSLSDWTGWIVVDEFDLLVLGAAAGSLAHQACPWREAVLCRQKSFSGATKWTATLRQPGFWLAGLALSYVLALLRGLLDAGDFNVVGGLQSYIAPLNGLRSGKSLFLVLLLLPSLRSLSRTAPLRVSRYLSAGMVIGLALATGTILWERNGFPGSFDFSTPYRTTALFWEMHVGGAALDFFLVLSVPFATYAVVNAGNRYCWLLAASLAVAVEYACLTTFSRGVYLGVAVSLSILFGLAAVSKRQSAFSENRVATLSGRCVSIREPWRVWGERLLLGILFLQVCAVLGLGDYMSRRFSDSEHDLGGRLQHWRAGLHLLRDPIDVFLGRGLGRFPANYSTADPEREMPGRLQIVEEVGEAFLRIFGPEHNPELRGMFELLQRMPSPVGGGYTVAMDLRTAEPARLSVDICRRHLLYPASCTRNTIAVTPHPDGWQRVSLSNNAKAVAEVSPVSPLTFLVLRLEGPAKFIDIDNLRLIDAQGYDMARNGSFSGGLAQWYFSIRHYFLPWHVDNLFIEVLIDQGVVGLLLLLVLLRLAYRNLRYGRGRDHTLAPYLMAALAACMAVGAVSSLMDMPRCAFLFYLLLSYALFLDAGAVAPQTSAPVSRR